MKQWRSTQQIISLNSSNKNINTAAGQTSRWM